MKIPQMTVLLVFISLLAFETTYGRSNDAISKRDFADLTFEVSLKQKEFIPLQPIFFHFKLSNNTSSKIAFSTVIDFTSSRMVMHLRSDKMEVKVIDQLSPILSQTPVTKDWLSPGMFWLTSREFELTGRDIFPVYGRYEIRFELRDDFSGKTILSNWVEIRMNEPQGVDATEYKYVRENKLDSDLLGVSSLSNDEMIKPLNGFVEGFSESWCVETAILRLAQIQSAKGDVKKCLEYLTRIKIRKDDPDVERLRGKI